MNSDFRENDILFRDREVNYRKFSHYIVEIHQGELTLNKFYINSKNVFSDVRYFISTRETMYKKYNKGDNFSFFDGNVP